MQVEVEPANAWPAVLDGQYLLLDVMGQAPRHRVEEADARDGDARLVPRAVSAFKDVHALSQRELADEVGAPCSRDSNLGLGDATMLGALDDRGPACELLFLRPVEVTACEHVAEVGVQEGPFVLDGQRWYELTGAFVGLLVHQEGGVDDIGVRREPLQDLLDLGHLGRISRADERANDDSRQSGLAE